MANLRSTMYFFLLAFQFLVLLQTNVLCYQYKVGDLDAWGIPTSANPQVYTKWSKYHTIKIGDSLLFLYPPSQDSLIQVTEESFNSCNLKDPILYMNNGNSLFNITAHGEFYFTSGKQGNCEKKQKLHISAFSGNGSADSPSYGPGISPSYPTVFGSIPQPPSSSLSSSSSSSPSLSFPIFIAALAGFLVSAFICE
ncbi:early nodulin-like protein 8 [Corylus avellana]|uniref:early nodulin-like protein 8 n=1 Tax=Corylus avellana TaxID=13451 RepID=UPI001E22F662|nr:early nodulin-like protein 8 [Corylus avellana]